MQWPDFAQRLGTVLARLAGDSQLDATLILSQSAQPLAYVQFVVNPGGIYAEVSSAKRYLPKDLRLSDESVDTLTRAGWSRPGAADRKGNWVSEIHPATAEACGQLAERCVTALRDVWGVPEPASLVYQAFHTDGEDLSAEDLGLPRDRSQ
ncbi:TY-Chap domain-containing protein [Stackebrandtia nassauensis]|uniref:TY-Chap N-terminal domain-containing protein n=1 Tax=Stackebrandtia nassauensis (strain DSM 44728 / CIP 108903 / NRRL B-16338 / NBRC 102104 / LLR-40K-21) TaxID=446470 RepID=D3PXB1_STANL|nr:hypothetical protein [Stackebrandtia nassauensis]ADD41374.1 hypothetical protein Snas_1672 [Stackebrandtia nassauensis DSM 44728]